MFSYLKGIQWYHKIGITDEALVLRFCRVCSQGEPRRKKKDMGIEWVIHIIPHSKITCFCSIVTPRSTLVFSGWQFPMYPSRAVKNIISPVVKQYHPLPRPITSFHDSAGGIDVYQMSLSQSESTILHESIIILNMC